jgi:hypothetical protein
MSGRSALRAAMGNRDANHGQVTLWYEELYCTVVDTHAVGGGFGDLVVKIPTKRGYQVKIVEVKTTDGRIRPSQARFAAEWGDAVAVVQTREDVHAHVERVRAAP